MQGEAYRLFRISAGFLLDQVRLGRWGMDFIDGLILTAVTQANVAPVMADPLLQRRYATYAAPPPDELRRPISVHATAHSLGLPYETVRRRMTALSRLGVYRFTPDGVVVPGANLLGLGHKRALEGAYSRLRSLYERLRAQGLLAEPPAPEPPVPDPESWDAPPLRIAARVSAEYLLRFADGLTASLDDLACGVIWLETFRNNREQLDDASAGDDAELRGARVSHVSDRLGMPAETVRRRAAQLVAQGACEWTRTGLVVPATALREPNRQRLIRRAGADLTRMYASLGQLGVIAAWQAEDRLTASRAA